MEANRKPKKRDKKVRINMTLCRYEVVRKIVRDRGWLPVTDEADKAAIESCNLHWIDVPDFQNTFQILKPYAKVNHFPGMSNIARKSKLARNIQRMRKMFPDDYDFCPRTYILPFDFHEFEMNFNSEGVSQKPFIVKPDHSCQGRGVFLTKTLAQVNRTDIFVAQPYIKNPLLIDGKKFDLRVYVLISCCAPLRVYLFRDGLVRMCTADYVAPNAENMEQRYMHLTNYAVNKHSDLFEKNKNAEEDGNGSKRSIKWFLNWLKGSHDEAKIDALWDKVGDICLKTILTVQPSLEQEYKSTFAKNLRLLHSAPAGPPAQLAMNIAATRPQSANDAIVPDLHNGTANSSSFSILGLDVLIDESLKPWLLEVNHLPSFGCDSPLDWNVKERLISQAFDIMQISAEDRDKYEAEMARSMQTRLYGGFSSGDNAVRSKHRNNRSNDNNNEEENDDDADGTRSKVGPEEEEMPTRDTPYRVLDVDTLRRALTAYYQEFNAERLKDLDRIVERYEHDQEELTRSLARKYGKSILDFVDPEQDAASCQETNEDDNETLIDFVRVYPPPRGTPGYLLYPKLLHYSQQNMKEQQQRFTAPLQHRKVDENEANMSYGGPSMLPPIKGAVKKVLQDQLGRDCFGITGTDKAKQFAVMEMSKKPLVEPSAEQIQAAHRLMLGRSSQEASIKSPPAMAVPPPRKQDTNFGLQYRERLATLKQKPTLAMTHISFGMFD